MHSRVYCGLKRNDIYDYYKSCYVQYPPGLIGSITSGCSGKEPGLLPRRLDTRERRSLLEIASWRFRSTDHVPIMGCENCPIEQEFGNRTFVWVRLPIVRQSNIRLSSIGRILLWVRLCSIDFGNRTIGVRWGSISDLCDWIPGGFLET